MTTAPALPSTQEIERRNRYWFTHWREFTAEVVVAEPRERALTIGMFSGSFFGAAPIPYDGRHLDRGPIQIREDGTVWVFARHHTYAWDLATTMVVMGEGGVEMRCPNQAVLVIQGPVAAPLAGAIAELGRA